MEAICFHDPHREGPAGGTGEVVVECNHMVTWSAQYTLPISGRRVGRVDRIPVGVVPEADGGPIPGAG